VTLVGHVVCYNKSVEMSFAMSVEMSFAMSVEMSFAMSVEMSYVHMVFLIIWPLEFDEMSWSDTRFDTTVA